MDNHNSQPSPAERFELLSAYLDGELTPSERQQVQEWLDNDPQFQQLYQKLLKLQRHCQQLPAPIPSITPTDLNKKVQQRLRRQQRREWLWGGGAIAAVALAALTTLFPSAPEYPMVALNRPTVSVSDANSQLVIPLNRPLVPIPSPN